MINLGDENYQNGLIKNDNFAGYNAPEEEATYSALLGAQWDVFANDEFNFDNISEGYERHGFTVNDQTQTMNFLESNEGKDSSIWAAAPAWKYYTPNAKQTFADFLLDEEKVAEYEAYLLANPDSGLKPVSEIKAQLAEESKARYQLVSDLEAEREYAGTDSWYDWTATAIAGIGGLAVNPENIAVFLVGSGKYKAGMGAVKRVFEFTKAFFKGAAVELPVQLDVKRYKTILGEDYNLFLNLGLAGAGNAFGGALISGATRIFRKLVKSGDITGTEAKALMRQLDETDNMRPVDLLEEQRSSVLMRERGYVSNARITLHKATESSVSSLSKRSVRGLREIEVRKISTLETRVGVRQARKILNQIKQAGKTYDEALDTNMISILEAQGNKGTYKSALEAMARKLKSNVVNENTGSTRIVSDTKVDAFKVGEKSADGPRTTVGEHTKTVRTRQTDLKEYLSCLIGG